MKEVLKIPLKATLYRHQQSACHFACERFGILPSETHSNGVALLMEMGCGKTITSIAIVGILYQYRHIRRILITAPLSILSVWEQEFARFAAFPYQLTVLKGSNTQKKERLSKLHGDGLQIAVVNYESAWRLEKELLAFHADLVIADEAHKIKENRTEEKAIFVDEVWQLIGASSNRLAAEFVLEIAKIIRAYSGAGIFATQDLNDFFALDDGKYGKGIINNCKTKIILNMEDEEAQRVKTILRLSETEVMNITHFQRGNGLISTNNNNITVEFKASNLEKELITTDRQELLEILKRQDKKVG